jgi:adenylate cyclase
MTQEIPPKTSNVSDPNCRWSNEAIRAQLNRILGHAEFHATDKMRDFLRFVVEEKLAGRSRNIKGFTIATEVYGRDAEFDAAHDPVVRIQAGRLRRAMERYYLVAGQQDPIRIEILKGSYVPVFSEGPVPESSPSHVAASPKPIGPAASWPTVLVMPFKDLTGNPDLTYLSAGLATELCVELGHCEDLRVILYRESIAEIRDSNYQPDFIVNGSILCDGSKTKIVSQLIDGFSGEQLWVDSLILPLEPENLITYQENAANSIAAHIGGTHAVITRTMSTHLGNRPPEELSTYQAILKGYAYHHTSNAVTYMDALEALQRARAREPECGLVCSMLAMQYFDNYSLEHFDLDRTPLDEAMRLAWEGVRTLPNSQLNRLILARGHMLRNELDLARSEVEVALAIHPESLLFMEFTGYLLLLLGDWDRGEQLVLEAIRQNPFYGVYSRYGLWLNAIRQQEYTQALEESEWIIDIGGFWGPLARAATLGLLGRSGEGRDAVRQLLLFKPNFQQRGRLLIGHYVKFPEIVEQLVEGLSICGMSLD